jgi:hypothetical protein
MKGTSSMSGILFDGIVAVAFLSVWTLFWRFAINWTWSALGPTIIAAEQWMKEQYDGR